MNKVRLSLIAWAAAMGLALAGQGCASRGKPVARPATQPVALDTRAELSLNQIQPVPSFATPHSATLPSTQPAPLDALYLYAQARGAVLENQRFTAINLLKSALSIDPSSFALHYALGEAQLGRALSNSDSIASFERAAAIKPRDLAVHLQLGRQYLSRANLDRALEHFRLAAITDEYQQDDDQAAVVDFFLARTLAQDGYLRAATDQYELLSRRTARPTLAIRGNPELAYMISRPALLRLQIGDLQEQRGRYEEALASYQRAEEMAGGGLEFRQRIVGALISLGRDSQAIGLAADTVRQFGANPASLDLLREAHKRLGREADVQAELRRLYAEHPDDRGILFALVDVLISSGNESEAEQLLLAPMRAGQFDLSVVRRTFKFYNDRNQTRQAALLLVEAMAARSDLLRDLSPMWNPLLRPSRKNRLKLAELQQLDVSPAAEASRLFWVSRIAEMWNRDALARSALERACATPPPFAPAYRVLLSDYWSRNEWDDAAKTEASRKLIDSTRAAGDDSLALELEGILLLNQDQAPQAVEILGRAVKARAASASPDLLLLYASALRAQGKESRGEQVLWKIVSDHPTCEDAYAALFRVYMEGGSVEQAVKVLQLWLSADPTSISARLLQASIYVQARQAGNAERILNTLLSEHSDNTEVLSNLQVFYEQSGRMDAFVDKLEEQRKKQPDNQAIAQQLVQIYVQRKQPSEAMRVLDETRAAAAQDPDLLYHVAHLYNAVDQPETSKQVLLEVLQIDPANASASNDLGYSWADEGVNLMRAEQLIRVAVEAEPDNQSFLDSLGWVLYKRARFDEAREYLDRAIAPATFPDPVVLDHLGDVLYRLGKRDEAQAAWKRSAEGLRRIGEDRDDLRELRLSLDKKLEQAEKGQPVTVAPIADDGTSSTSRQVGAVQGN